MLVGFSDTSGTTLEKMSELGDAACHGFVTACLSAGDVSLALVEVECEAVLPQASADAVAASRPKHGIGAQNLCFDDALSPVMKPPERVFSTFAPSLVGAAGLGPPSSPVPIQRPHQLK